VKKPKAKQGGRIVKNEMPSLLLEEKICFTSRYTAKFLAGPYGFRVALSSDTRSII
jgi:hypothetical protein